MKKFLRNKTVEWFAIAALKTLLLISTFLVILISFYGFSSELYFRATSLFDLNSGYFGLKLPILFFTITLILGLVSSVFLFRTLKINRKARKQAKKTGGLLGISYLFFGIWLIVFASYCSYSFMQSLSDAQEKMYAFVLYLLVAVGAFGILIIIDYLNSVRLIRAVKNKLDIDQFGQAL